jgi:maltose/moltooligosaccharide transporter
MPVSQTAPLPTHVVSSNPLKGLTWQQLFNLSVGIVGIQFAWVMQITLSSRVMEPLGGSPFLLGLIASVSAIIGLFIQPLVGLLSDKIWTPLGRRRPFILLGALLGTFAIFSFPFSQSLLTAALLTWVIEAGLNTAQGPYRTLVPDMVPQHQSTLANSVLSLAFGVGSVISMSLPFVLSLFHTNLGIEWQYRIAATVLLCTIAYSSYFIREPAHARNQQSSHVKNSFGSVLQQFRFSSPEIHKLCGVHFLTWLGVGLLHMSFTQYVVHHIYQVPDLSVSAYKTLEKSVDRIEPLMTKLSRTPTSMTGKAVADYIAFKELTTDFINIEYKLDNLLGQLLPGKSLGKLSFEQKESLLFSNQAPSQLAYHPLKALQENHEPLYIQHQHLKAMKLREKTAVKTNQIAFLVYNLVSLLLAFPIAGLCRKWGKKRIYTLSLAIFAMALAAAPFVHTPNQVIAMMAVAGIGWSAILSLPFAMLGDYLPENNKGAFFGIFNIFVCLPQLMSFMVMGKIIEMNPAKTAFGVSHQWSIAFVCAAIAVLGAMLLLQCFKEKQTA